MDAHLGQALNVGNRAQIFRVHNVGAVFIFERGHIFARTLGFFNHKHLVRGRADAQRRLDVLHRDRFVLVNDIADVVFFAFLNVVLPAAGVGAGALVGIAFVDIAREQAAARVGHAQRAVNEDFNFHLRHLAANFGDLIQRQLAGENHAGQPHLLPELDCRPVDGVSLYREVNIHVGEILAHQHN